MMKEGMKQLIKQLDQEDKELIAVTDEYILVKWLEDKSYVSWMWYVRDNKFIFECGHYMPCTNATEEQINTVKEKLQSIVNKTEENKESKEEYRNLTTDFTD